MRITCQTKAMFEAFVSSYFADNCPGLQMTFFERCHDIGHLALRLCGQRVNVIQEELPFHRQSAGIH
jgi:hypothetical protein